MANENTLVVEKNGDELEVKIYDGDGTPHEITSAFRSISGSTSPSAVTNTIECQDGMTQISIDFVATGKELKFVLDTSVVKQLVQLAE